MTAADHATETTNDKASAPLAELKTRFPHVRPPIVAALHVLINNPGIALEDAKVKAKELGCRITAASVSAAQRLQSRMDAPAAVTAPAAPTPATRPARRTRAAEAALDAEGLIRNVVQKLASQGNAEAEKLRATIRRAVELLQSALA